MNSPLAIRTSFEPVFDPLFQWCSGTSLAAATAAEWV